MTLAAPATTKIPAHQFLRAANSHGFARAITGTPERPHKFGGTDYRPWTLERFAGAVANADEMAVGIKPEGELRWLVIDIDAKAKRRSPYWDAMGQNLYLMALQRAAEAAGCRVVVIRSSSSKGLHLWILLPEMTKAHLVHHVGQELVARAGMHVQDGICEIFPSELPWSRSGTPPQSKGVRLPGGKGSALLVGDAFIDDPQSIYEELLAELDNTEATAAWEALLNDAKARNQSRFDRGRMQRKRSYGKQAAMPGPWTGRGQSNDLIGKLTRVAAIQNPGATEQQIIDAAIELIEAHPGYQQHASRDTKRRVRNGAWPSEWLHCLRKTMSQLPAPERPRDSHRNERLRDEAIAKVTALFNELGDGILELSERAGAAAAGVARATWRKLLPLLRDLVYTPY